MATRSLGTLTMDLVARIGGFEKGLDKAGRDLDRKTREMHKRAEQFGRQLGTALKVGFGIGVAAVSLYIKNTIEAEKVQAQLVSRIKDTGAAAGRTLAQLNAQADKLQSVTVFDDEAIGEAQAALMTFTNVTGETFDRAIESATDLATVMGTDVPDAAKLLGKALADPVAGIGALRKAGILLSEDQKNLIKDFQASGDIAGAQDVILRQLAGTMGTAAEAARDTLGGALQGLKNAFDNMLEGDSGSAGALGAKKAIQDLTEQMNSADVKAGFDSIVGGLAMIAQFAIEAIGAVNGFAHAISEAWSENNMKGYDALLRRFDELDGKIKKIKDRGASSEGLFGLGTTLKELEAEKAEVQKLLAALRQHPKTGGGKAAPNAFALDGNVTINADPDLFGISPKHRGGGGGRKDHSREDALERMRKQIEEADEATKDFQAQLQDMRDEIAGPLDQALTDHNRKLAELDELAKKGNTSADELNKAKEAETELYNKRVEAIEKTLNPLAEVIKQQEHELELLGLTGPALQTANDLYGMSAEQIAKYGATIAANNEQMAAVRDQIDRLDEARQTASNFFQDLAKNGISALDRLAQHIQDLILQQLGNKLAESLFGAMGTPGGGGGGFFGFLGGLFGGNKGGSTFGIPLPGSGLIPGFASGTNYSQGGMALVGERGPELVNLPRGSQVMPNHRLRGAMGGDTYNITVPVSGEVSRKTKHDVAYVTARRLDLARRGSLK